jgi:hypothetical protein
MTHQVDVNQSSNLAIWVHIQKELISDLNRFFSKRKGVLLNDCKRLKRLTNEKQHCHKFLLIQQNNFFTHCKLISNDVEIIAYKIDLFKNP